MTNISAANRDLLKEKYDVGRTNPTRVQISIDGTKKYLYPVDDGKFIETAYIPEPERATLCVSVQVGCKMGCVFCMTGKQGFQANLTSGEIINQLQSLPEFEEITNIVFMGMGEPFDNKEELLKALEILTSEYGYALSPKRITVSSIGLINGLKEFLDKSKCHLAISMHTPFEEERLSLMPIQKVHPLKEIVSVIRGFDFGLQRRISFEYIMFSGVNDTTRHINEIAKVLNGIRCRINLIRFHAIPGSELTGSDYQTMRQFQEGLMNKGIITTIRESRGEDILAACGMLSTKELPEN